MDRLTTGKCSTAYAVEQANRVLAEKHLHKTVRELKETAKDLGAVGYSGLNRSDLLALILEMLILMWTATPIPLPYRASFLKG